MKFILYTLEPYGWSLFIGKGARQFLYHILWYGTIKRHI